MPDDLLIPYGTLGLRAEQVVAQGGVIDCPVPHVAIDRHRDGILRLNGGQYSFPEAPDLRAMTDATVQLEYLRSHLQHYCDLWARPPKLFLECYFAFVTRCVDANRTKLKQVLEPFGSLFAVEDWTLSAPRPLPRAQVFAEGNFQPVDFVFWLGNRVVAILLKGASTDTEQGRRTALTGVGVEIVQLSNTELAKIGPEYLSRALPPEFANFWSDEVMPSSPFKGTSLGDIVRE